MIKYVIKIGGSIFNSPSSLFEFLRYIQKTEIGSIIIISAFGKSTQELRKIALKSIDDLESAEELILNFHQTYLNFAFEINSTFFNEFSLIVQHLNFQLLELANGINLTHNLSSSILDKILSFGEDYSFEFIKLLCKYFNIDACFLDAKQIIKTDSDFGKSKPNYSLCETNLIKCINDNKNPIYFIQGFIGSDKVGKITTMGFESSNLTSTIIAKVFNIEQIEIVTDVEGLRNLDPIFLLPNKLVSNIDYKLAYNLANNGLNLIFKDMIFLAEEQNIKIKISNLESKYSTYIYKDIECNEKILILNSISKFGKLNFETLNEKRRLEEEIKKLDFYSFVIEKTIYFIYPKGYNFRKIKWNFEKINTLYEISIFNLSLTENSLLLELEGLIALNYNKQFSKLFISTDNINESIKSIYELVIK